MREKAAKYATENASKNLWDFVPYVRKAIAAGGGIPLCGGGDASHYKYILTLINFHKVSKKAKRKVGDIVVFQPIGNVSLDI